MPLAVGIMCASVVAFKSCFERRRFQQPTKGHLCRTHDLHSHSDIYVCCNLSGNAAHTFLNICVAEHTISPATMTCLSCVSRKSVECVLARVDARAAVNVQLHNVAVVEKNCASGGNAFKFDTKPSSPEFHRHICVPLAEATSVRARLCLKVVLNGAVFSSRQKATLAERMIFSATATFMCVVF